MTSPGRTAVRWSSAFLLLLAGTTQFAEPAPAVEAQPPNVLIIVTDDQRIGTLGMMPATRQRFLTQGVEFTNAFATTPVCCPSRASIFTGRYAHNHGVRTNLDKDRLDHDTTIQRYLQEHGYLTAMGGKLLNEWRIQDTPLYFDRYLLLEAQYFNPEVNRDGTVSRVGGYGTSILREYMVELVEDFDRRDDAAPWFMYVAPHAPHQPADPEPRYSTLEVPPFERNPAVRERNRADKPRYVRNSSVDMDTVRVFRKRQLRTLRSVDDLVSSLWQTLLEAGEAQNTLAIFLSDNGYLWGEHGLRAKGHAYTHSVRIPMAMRWPGEITGGVSDGRFAANVDIAPTVLDAAGITVDDGPPMDGRSLLDEDRRSEILLETWGTRRWASIRSRRFQYTEYRTPGGRIEFREYYPLITDPWQLHNVLGDSRRGNDPDVRTLHQLLTQARACVGVVGSSACP